MSYRYIPRPEFEHDLEGILESIPAEARPFLEGIARAVVVRLAEGSVSGEPLQGRLSDCLKFKFDLPAAKRHLHPATDADPAPRWRIVYRIVASQLRDGSVEKRLDVLAISPREELSAYRLAAHRLRRGG